MQLPRRDRGDDQGISQNTIGQSPLDIPHFQQVHGAVGKTPGVNSLELYLAGPDNVGQHGLSRKHIFDSVQASLKRLQLDYIDVLQFSYALELFGLTYIPGHRFDYDTPVSETASFWLLLCSSIPDPQIRCKPYTMLSRLGLCYSHGEESRFDYFHSRWVRYIGMSSCYAWQCEFCCSSASISRSITLFK